jgi:hypothetical protein
MLGVPGPYRAARLARSLFIADFTGKEKSFFHEYQTIFYPSDILTLFCYYPGRIGSTDIKFITGLAQDFEMSPVPLATSPAPVDAGSANLEGSWVASEDMTHRPVGILGRDVWYLTKATIAFVVHPTSFLASSPPECLIISPPSIAAAGTSPPDDPRW